ncbi:MAG: T9SS type A sorting domain-containing protein, partial [Bacteroidota bacterium]
SVFSGLNRLQAGQSYWWSVITRDEWNTTANPDSFRIVRGGPTGVPTTDVPYEFTISQNYPNPFNPVTVISYQLPAAGPVSLKVYSMLGEEVATLVDEVQSAGKGQVVFDARALSSGVYVYRIVAGEYAGTRKLILLR